MLSPALGRAPAAPPRLLLLLLTLLLSSPLDVAVAEELTFSTAVPYSSIAAGIQRACQSSREAKCCGHERVIRYSNEPFFSVSDHTHVDDTRWTLVTRFAEEADSWAPLRFSSGGMIECMRCLSNYTGDGSCYDKPFDILLPTPARPPSSLEPAGEPSPSPLPHKRAKTVHLTNISSAGSLGLLLIILGLMIWWQLPKPAIVLQRGNNLLDDDDLVTEDNFRKREGPKRFPYDEMAIVTDNLSGEKKLGEGGFSSPCRCLLLLVLTVVQSSSLDIAVADFVYQPDKPYCSTTNNYTNQSEYGANLRYLLEYYLSSEAISNNGFYNGSMGVAPDEVFGLTMCYPECDWAQCKRCLISAATTMLQMCPFSREVKSCDSTCLFRYSDNPFFSVADLSPACHVYDDNYVSDAAALNSTRWDLMTRLAEAAALSPWRLSTGRSEFMDDTPLFGLVQCTRDLNATECKRCIYNYISQLPSVLPNTPYGALKGYSCCIEYKLSYPFKEDSWALALLQPPASPPSSPPASPQPGEPSPSPPVPLPPPPKTGLVISISLGSIALLFFIILILLILWQRSKLTRILQTAILLDDDDIVMEDDFGKGTGPKRFPYKELAIATDNFSDEKKLGEGGFGSVYRGFLKEENLDVAIKRVSKGSKQGKKEYISEVTIISRLRHRNLVQLIGWCHAGGELLLIYELMSNSSLDTHLHAADNILPWKARYEIVLGLGSGLLYLHQEWEQCVLHRDIKPSNIMLDASFNAKLGDFGLARLVNHGRGSYTTMLAGTMGYMDPECFSTGKASTESDVYSFGVVLLEVACGRQPMMAADEDDIIHLVQWVWNLFESGKILEAADARLNMDFDDMEVKCVMIVGMWCTHPDLDVRPSIKQAVRVLRFEAPFPVLPPRMSATTYKMNVFDSFLSTSRLSGGR